MTNRILLFVLNASLLCEAGQIDQIHLYATIDVTPQSPMVMEDTETFSGMFELLVTGGTGTGFVELAFNLEAENTPCCVGPLYYTQASAGNLSVPTIEGNTGYGCENSYFSPCNVNFSYGVPEFLQINAMAKVYWNQEHDPVPNYPGVLFASVDLRGVNIVVPTTATTQPGDVTFVQVGTIDTMPEPKSYLLVIGGGLLLYGTVGRRIWPT